jgi:WD40 repeat protein
MGYEKALKSFEGHYSRETGDVVKEYLSAAKNNRLLERRLRERLAEFGQGTKREKPRGAALKVAAERIGEVRRLEGHTDWVSSESFSPDSRLLASGSADHTVRLWDPETGQEVWKQEINASVVSVDFSPDGRLLAFALGNYAGQELGTDFSIRLWNPETGQEVRRLEGHTDSVSSVRFSPDGRLLASGSHDQTVRLWNPETGLEIRKLHGHGSNVNSVDFSPDGRLLASASGNYSEQKTDDDYTVRLWNLETGLEIRRLLGHRSSVNAISFSPDGRLLVSASGFVPEDPAAPPIGSDDTVRLWNIETGQEVQRLKSHTRYVYKVVFSPDGRFIVSSSGDRTIRIWDLCTKECTAIITRKFHKVGGLALSSDGRYMVSGSSEKYEPQLWDISSLECGA